MNENRLVDYLDHIWQAATDACSFVEGQSKADFLDDKRTQQAVILNLLIIGEAATKLLQSHGQFLAQHPEISWASMKGMRNRLAHGYFDTNLDVVWETVQKPLRELLERLPGIRDEAGKLPGERT